VRLGIPTIDESYLRIYDSYVFPVANKNLPGFTLASSGLPYAAVVVDDWNRAVVQSDSDADYDCQR